MKNSEPYLSETAHGTQGRVASLERCLGTNMSHAQHHQTENRLLANRPMVMMQLVQQDVARSITVESVVPEVDSQPAVSVLPADSPHSSLSSVGAELCTETPGFTLFRTNDLFCSESRAANSSDQQMPDGTMRAETPVAGSEEQPPQSQLVWQENPEFSGQAMGRPFQMQL